MQKSSSHKWNNNDQSGPFSKSKATVINLGNGIVHRPWHSVSGQHSHSWQSENWSFTFVVKWKWVIEQADLTAPSRECTPSIQSIDRRSAGHRGWRAFVALGETIDRRSMNRWRWKWIRKWTAERRRAQPYLQPDDVECELVTSAFFVLRQSLSRRPSVRPSVILLFAFSSEFLLCLNCSKVWKHVQKNDIQMK